MSCSPDIAEGPHVGMPKGHGGKAEVCNFYLELSVSQHGGHHWPGWKLSGLLAGIHTPWEPWSMKLPGKGISTEQEVRRYHRKIEQSLKTMSGTLRRHRADMDTQHLSDVGVSPVCCEYTQVLGFSFLFSTGNGTHHLAHTRQTLYYHNARAPRLTPQERLR